MRSVTPRDLHGHCPRCVLNLEICICADLPRIDTRTEIVLVRHIVERGITSNTGRFAALALSRSQLLEYGGGPAFDDSLITAPDTALLYASGPSTRPLSFVPKRLIVLDGTFRQARRMYKRIPALRELPEMALPAPRVVPTRLRKPTHAEGMSTLEAIAAALTVLEGSKVGAPLYELHSELVRRADRLRGRKREIVLAGA